MVKKIYFQILYSYRRFAICDLLLLLFFLFANSSFSQSTELSDFGSNPGNLRGYIHSPKNLSDSLKYPLVIALHGCTQNANEIEEQSGWSVLADSHQFYVLYPEQKRINNANNCFNWFFKGDCTKDKGEVASIHQMMEKMCDSLNVDTSRVFIYGLSAGALMSVSFAACYPDELKCCASLAGGAYTGGLKPGKGLANMIKPEEQTPQQLAVKVKKQNPGYSGNYPGLIVLHGMEDKVVNYNNSLELIKQWQGLHDEKLVELKFESGLGKGKGFSRKIFGYPEAEFGEIVFYTFYDGGHTLPVDPGTGNKQGGKTGMFANDMDFFSTWYIAKDFGLLK